MFPHAQLCQQKSDFEQHVLEIPPKIFTLPLGDQVAEWHDVTFADVIQYTFPVSVRFESTAPVSPHMS